MEPWQQVLRNQSIAPLQAPLARFGPQHFPGLARPPQGAGNI